MGTFKKRRTVDEEGVKRLYIKGVGFNAIRNLTGWPVDESARIVKEAGLFNPKKQHDFYRDQAQNKRAN